ncbi:hypothetical protein [Methylobacterium sp. J-068]|uniref:hypothetical protein n=1 Tax=Methylobacterium sp. J-068 TaxID=2836649 RepID=UPI001FB931B5|nr:hypothetical protein [Methylobacterium sp. J-068]MCJ2035254.1 hypothetical protein [Methylobacterium sp. J-068]
MPRRAAMVTQADIARAIRAIQAAGLPVMRVVVRTDGVAVETVRSEDERDPTVSPSEVANEGRVVVL